MAHKTKANVVKAYAFMAHVVGTTVHRSQKPEMRGTLARPVTSQIQDDLCYRSGGIDHWSRTCRASAQVVEEYHASRVTHETNLVEESFPTATILEITDFQAVAGEFEDQNSKTWI